MNESDINSASVIQDSSKISEKQRKTTEPKTVDRMRRSPVPSTKVNTTENSDMKESSKLYSKYKSRVEPTLEINASKISEYETPVELSPTAIKKNYLENHLAEF